jgi:hypothetical protein
MLLAEDSYEEEGSMVSAFLGCPEVQGRVVEGVGEDI